MVGVRGYYWYPDAPQEDSLRAWIRVFELHGYRTSDSPDLVFGTEKIAIYVDSDGTPSHVARQKDSGLWTSKLGRGEDIEHEALEGLEGDEYGTAAEVMERPRQGQGVTLG